jgi:stress-induced morphogen
MTESELKALIEAGIDGATVRVRDMTGTMDHYDVDVVSPAFEGKTMIEQHKMVHAAVGQHLTTTIHALQIKTRTP